MLIILTAGIGMLFPGVVSCRINLGFSEVGAIAAGQLAALYDAHSATRRPMLCIWIRCGGPFGPGHGQTAEYIRAFLDEGKNAGDVRKDLDTSTAGLVLQDVYIGALCRWAASETDTLEQHLQPALDLVMPLLR